jgi:hypothetical protein
VARRRKGKTKTSNKEWVSPTDGDAKVAKMKDGRTHLAHKAEHSFQHGPYFIMGSARRAIGGASRIDIRCLEAHGFRMKREIAAQA